MRIRSEADRLLNKNMDKEKLIKDAQYRKGLSIAFFNANNAAIELLKGKNMSTVNMQKAIVSIRDWFLDEHAKYHLNVIERIGLPYDPKDSIKKLMTARSNEGLLNVWLLLSEDERHDASIVKVKNQLKAKYEKAQRTAKKPRVAAAKKG